MRNHEWQHIAWLKSMYVQVLVQVLLVHACLAMHVRDLNWPNNANTSTTYVVLVCMGIFAWLSLRRIVIQPSNVDQTLDVIERRSWRGSTLLNWQQKLQLLMMTTVRRMKSLLSLKWLQTKPTKQSHLCQCLHLASPSRLLLEQCHDWPAS